MSITFLLSEIFNFMGEVNGCPAENLLFCLR